MKINKEKQVSKFLSWYDENDSKEYDFYTPPMKAEVALDMLVSYLLPEDYYIVDPVRYEQGNTIEVKDILMKYSKKFRKEIKERRKEIKNG